MRTYYTISDMQSYAQPHNGKCLSKEYIDFRSPLTWKCDRGHVFESALAYIKQGRWCMQCAKEEWRQERLDAIIAIAEKKGGKCLSTYYQNVTSKLKFICAKGHRWNAPPYMIVNRGSWCAKCVTDFQRLSIDEYRQIAKKKGGKLLSEDYSPNSKKLEWQCSEGHVWMATGASVKHKSWCPTCGYVQAGAKMKKDIGIYRKIAERHGGKLLSETYEGAHVPITWQCGEGHVWKAEPASIRKGSWCLKCRYAETGKKHRLSIDVYKAIAKQRGGKLISETYNGCYVPMTWQCSKGHVWTCKPYTVKKGSWCPKCAHINTGNRQRGNIGSLKVIIEKHGGKLISGQYVNNHSPLVVQCERGHVWKMNGNLIKRNVWCMKCYHERGRKRKPINIAK